jgi:phosphoribosylaminoimidazole-succinocarboxamide synthase
MRRAARTGAEIGKDVFRRDLRSLSDACAEVARRLGIMPEGAAKPGQGPKLVR